jgi:hypothetical protein
MDYILGGYDAGLRPRKEGRKMNDILFRKTKNQKEERSQATKSRVFISMPSIEGYIKVYKPYGEQGRGFYYKREEIR